MSETNNTEGKTSPISKLSLNTIANSRRSYSRLIRARMANQIDGELFKQLINALNGYLGYFKAETEAEIMKRIEALEQSRVHTGY